MNTDETRTNKNQSYFIRANPRLSAARKSNPGIGLETITRDNSQGNIFSNMQIGFNQDPELKGHNKEE
jgi:hypothetical protein